MTYKHDINTCDCEFYYKFYTYVYVFIYIVFTCAIIACCSLTIY